MRAYQTKIIFTLLKGHLSDTFELELPFFVNKVHWQASNLHNKPPCLIHLIQKGESDKKEGAFQLSKEDRCKLASFLLA